MAIRATWALALGALALAGAARSAPVGHVTGIGGVFPSGVRS